MVLRWRMVGSWKGYVALTAAGISLVYDLRVARADAGATRPAATLPAVAPEPTLAWNRTRPWYRYWADQDSRWFVSSDVSLGFTQSLRGTLGYGQPFWRFVGLEAQVLSTLEFGAVAFGPRIDALFINALFDFRSTWSYSRHRPLRADSYATFEDAAGPVSKYAALEGSLWTYLPLGPALGYVEMNGIYVWDRSASYAVFEEYYRATLNADTAMFARAMLSVTAFRESLRFGPAGDLVLTPGRDPLVRVGGVVTQQFTPHLTLMLALTVPVATPDELSTFTQSWGIARIRYSFASGEPEPGF